MISVKVFYKQVLIKLLTLVVVITDCPHVTSEYSVHDQMPEKPF